MKREEAKAMPDDALNRTLAELFGWKRIRKEHSPRSLWPEEAIWQIMKDIMVPPDGVLVRDGKLRQPPNYCTDLNAMHRAEETLTEDQWVEYIDNLKTLLSAHSNSYRSVRAKVHATARQKAEALATTLDPSV